MKHGADFHVMHCDLDTKTVLHTSHKSRACEQTGGKKAKQLSTNRYSPDEKRETLFKKETLSRRSFFLSRFFFFFF